MDLFGILRVTLASLALMFSGDALATTPVENMTPTELATYIAFGLQDRTSYATGNAFWTVAKISDAPTTLTVKKLNQTLYQTTVTPMDNCFYAAAFTINQAHTINLKLDFRRLTSVTLPQKLSFGGSRIKFDGDFIQCGEPSEACVVSGTQLSLAGGRWDVWFPAANLDQAAHQQSVNEAIAHFKQTICPAQ